MTNISNLQLSPEETRRQHLHVAIVQEAPETMLNLLTDIVENKDWEDYGMSFLEYIETPYSMGGIGWTRRNLKAIIHFEHRKEIENTDQDFMLPRLKDMRDFVAHELKVEIPPSNPNGTNRYTSRVGNTNPTPVSNNAESALRRLKRDRPDLAEQVIEGKLSPHRAAIEAGFRKPREAVRMDDAASAARTILDHMERETLLELLAILNEEIHK